jgi:hypothetical protein
VKKRRPAASTENRFGESSSPESLAVKARDSEEGTPSKVVVVGAGTRFLSAMSYYTIRLANALGGPFDVVAIPMRQLLPTFMYPGRSRVGSMATESTGTGGRVCFEL